MGEEVQGFQFLPPSAWALNSRRVAARDGSRPGAAAFAAPVRTISARPRRWFFCDLPAPAEGGRAACPARPRASFAWFPYLQYISLLSLIPLVTLSQSRKITLSINVPSINQRLIPTKREGVFCFFEGRSPSTIALLVSLMLYGGNNVYQRFQRLQRLFYTP